MSTTPHAAIFEMQQLTVDMLERLDALAPRVGPKHLHIRVARAHVMGLTDLLDELGVLPVSAIESPHL